MAKKKNGEAAIALGRLGGLPGKENGRIRMKDYIYIPPSSATAGRHLHSALAGKLKSLSGHDFMKAYCSVAYLYPGFHPDNWEDWEGPAEIKPLLAEAWRRAEAGELSDNELYPYQATKAAIVQAQRSA